jgi:hypothetical protein
VIQRQIAPKIQLAARLPLTECAAKGMRVQRVA